jgi:hypothetical protein
MDTREKKRRGKTQRLSIVLVPLLVLVFQSVAQATALQLVVTYANKHLGRKTMNKRNKLSTIALVC